MAIRHSITLSTSEPNNEVGNLKIRQGDEQTQTLVANITENGVPKPFTGLQPFFCAKLGQTAGLGIIEQKVTGPMNPANGTLEYVMQPEDWQQLGRQTAYFSFRKMVNDHEWTEQFSTRDFNYNVTKSAFSEGLREVKKDGSTYVWTIEDMLRLFKEYMASGKTDWEEFVEQNREILESVDPGGKLIGELIDARRPFGGEAYPTLGERLDSEKAEVTTQLAETVKLSQYCVGDGVTDDTIGFQTAVNTGKKIIGEKGKTYLITSKITLIDNTHILGNGAKLLNKFMSSYNMSDNCLFGVGLKNITIENLIIDGGVGTFTFTQAGETLSGNSLIKLQNCTNVKILDCKWQNYNQAWGGSSNSFHVVSILESENVTVERCIQSDVYPEGLLIENSVHVILTDFKTDNANVSTVWTPLHLFYCKYAVVENIKVDCTSVGSSINMTCQDFVLRDAVINGGKGLDLSNESATVFQVKNGIIDNVVLNEGQIYSHPHNGGPLENIIIKNSTVNLKNQGTAIRLDTPLNVIVDNCKINVVKGTFTTDFITLFEINAYGSVCGNVELNNVIFTGDVSAVLKIVNNTLTDGFEGVKLSNIQGVLTRTAQSSAGGNGSIITFTGNNVNSYVDDLLIKNCKIGNMTGTIFNRYNYGYYKNVVIERCEITGNNDTTSKFSENFTLLNSRININKMFSDGDASRIKTLYIKDNIITGYDSNDPFIAWTSQLTPITISGVIIKNNVITRLPYFINNVHANVLLDSTCDVDVPELLIRSTNQGDYHARRVWKQSGVLGVPMKHLTLQTDARVLSPVKGQYMFDITLNKPIWFNGTEWIDGAGTIV